MAVKQHVTETTNNQPKCDMNKMIQLIEALLAKPEILSSPNMQKEVCEYIVQQLAHTPVEREALEIKAMKTEIGKVCHFFQKLRDMTKHDNDIVSTCLKALYKAIISDKETSNYASAVLVLVDKDSIKEGVRFLIDADNTAIEKIFRTLSHWLETNDYAPDLSIWVTEILIGLRNKQKHELLLQLCQGIVESYWSKLAIPIFLSKLGPVVLCILKITRHQPKILDLIVQKIPKILFLINQREKTCENTSILFQELVDTISALTLPFLRDQRYKELEESLHGYPRSKNYSQLFDVPPWQDTLQNVKITSSNARVGLVNLGNTCYMNSVLQALVMTKQFCREILLSKIEAPLFFQIQKLLALLLHSTRPELTPRALLAAARPPDFAPGYQQDSSEFLGYLLEKLHEQEKNLLKHQCCDRAVEVIGLPTKIDNRLTSTVLEANQTIYSGAKQLQQTNDHPFDESLLPPTLIQKTFDGKLYVTYECGRCGSKSTNNDAFRSFELSFPAPNNYETGYSVQKLLDFYCSSEKLIGENRYYCDQCKQLCDGERSIQILKSPKNLILTLKHFRYDQQKHTRAKLMNKVRHDEVISLPVITELGNSIVVQYSLYAAVVHAGTSMDSGHYYTYAQDEPDSWYKFNDNYVTKCSVDELHALSSPNTPYILFYQMLFSPFDNNFTTSSLEIDDEVMDKATDILKTAHNVPLASPLPTSECQLPQLEELPPHLKGLVLNDNQSYREEIQSESRKRTQRHNDTRDSVLPKNHDSDSDEPPSSYTDNSIKYSNRFIY
ncbi:ubiquitin carboxyl-terminal hydrolase 38 [Toxorhynchites rutilus septentrionalis]|uniref:ubiquitin carboxyl-terminal hydrolase 38 n=1 Tax=Toxorhynchites rutilus septentrionalis TaxID=329112 RepID=UPI00247A6211|nr:ubiquitin carboxyl-terminal hydrolase 38 [Toxorhynchites rutilus septentrionalis]XP_055638638.1 ubiquitin carboxyl-terminal hydrolase 38 [Toxorhynchites rutilus septentrionalis]XP_055638640.1 ubiquitin carboxyl-terminal hydrolase 38 [Toxorhynchites rutilus septentrionalis]XP_055638641.1 ubiquitin carboxyl-terminal hydrolase 38 [Toxorhynchites rutilus septentrionalis]XP_055638642.1 ubiquitin carboxyl-terminal hydrolase 38 [Toxorhynchites rutilus septentrionalis]XP_055638643.1 ubiquitin carbo